MYSMVIIVNILLYTLSFLRVDLKTSHHTQHTFCV